MSSEKYDQLVRDMCKAVGVSDADGVLQRGAIVVEGYEMMLAHYNSDEHAMYLNFNFGIVGPGRTQPLFERMLTSNMTIYAQDQAQLGVHPDTGGLLLIVRIPMTDEVDGNWLVETVQHYLEHGRYWRESMFNTTDEMNDVPSHMHFVWMKA